MSVPDGGAGVDVNVPSVGAKAPKKSIFGGLLKLGKGKKKVEVGCLFRVF